MNQGFVISRADGGTPFDYTQDRLLAHHKYIP